MRNPSAAELIRVWELGQGRRTWLRGLLLLAPLFPDLSLQKLGAISLGTRNAHLLELRGRMFGSEVAGIVDCPACHTQIEFSLEIETLLTAHTQDCWSAYDTRYEYSGDETAVECRLLCSDDLRFIGDEWPTAAAVGEQVVLNIEPDAQLAPAVLEAVADTVLTADPLADIRMSVTCESCAHEWSMGFDIVSFLWKEIDAEVARLFDDVHRLSAAYGWSEAVILTMSAHRRRQYLERAS